MSNPQVAYNSLYQKLQDGRHMRDFPENFFEPISSFQDGLIVVETVRWKRVTMIEAYYEWTLPFTRKMELVPDYMNGYCKLYPDWYIVRVISTQREHVTMSLDGIYDLSSSTYSEVYIDSESGSQVAAPKYRPSPSFKWSGGEPLIREQSGNIITKMVPVSLREKDYPIFASVIEKINQGIIKLPPVT